MQLTLTRYAVYFNLRHGRHGHVFQARFKALVCNKRSYFSELIQYIHMNPVRAKIVLAPEDWIWSSHREYLGEKSGLVDPSTALSLLSDEPVGPRGNVAIDRAIREGWRSCEIARFLGCSQAAVSKRLAKSVVKA